MRTARVRPARQEDVGAVGIVGPAAYAAAYGYLWQDPAGLAAQLETFGAPAFAEFLARPDTAAWVASLDETIVGFLTMVLNSADPVTKEPGGAEIPRIYLLPGAQRHGFGRLLLDQAMEHARSADQTHIWLDVMDSKTGARSAYAKWGFIEIGTSVFDDRVKPELAGMVVCKITLRDAQL